jgi:thiosulfate/3-mercaptopyruvate sulfurtransferase
VNGAFFKAVSSGPFLRICGPASGAGRDLARAEACDPMTARRNLVETEWLARHFDDPSVAIADCRFELAKPGAGRAAYDDAHIPGAVYLDLERDLSGPKRAHGGRHPLPDRDVFCRTLGALGIDDSVTVVAYDVPQAAVAPRLWWMLRYLGHDRVRVLDGGWPAWRAAGLPVSREAPRRPARRFVPHPRPELAADVEGVRRIVAEGGARLVDARAPERYRGEVEPLDPVAGHVPGAVNLPWNETLDERGRLKPKAALMERFGGLGGAGAVVYCGSGVTACANLLAMDEAGLSDARLYPGSWSDWCSYSDNPVASAKTDAERSTREEERKG